VSQLQLRFLRLVLLKVLSPLFPITSTFMTKSQKVLYGAALIDDRSQTSYVSINVATECDYKENCNTSDGSNNIKWTTERKLHCRFGKISFRFGLEM
jgi:hypothetical protein